VGELGVDGRIVKVVSKKYDEGLDYIDVAEDRVQ
jgi:hypothetical protein